MTRVLLISAVLVVAFTVFSVVDCAMTERRGVRALPKALWLVLIVVLPPIGGALWLGIGRAPARRPLLAPDDDPTFLASAGAGARPGPATRFPSRSTPAEPDADEIRRLEEEFARTDPDDDGDSGRA